MAGYKADRRLYLDVNGVVVEDGDPTAHTLLITPGKMMPEVRARALGLIVDAPPEAEPVDLSEVDTREEPEPESEPEGSGEPVLHEAEPEPTSRRRR